MAELPKFNELTNAQQIAVIEAGLRAVYGPRSIHDDSPGMTEGERYAAQNTLTLKGKARRIHQHESWQVREAPDGTWYCAACGEEVAGGS